MNVYVCIINVGMHVKCTHLYVMLMFYTCIYIVYQESFLVLHFIKTENKLDMYYNIALYVAPELISYKQIPPYLFVLLDTLTIRIIKALKSCSYTELIVSALSCSFLSFYFYFALLAYSYPDYSLCHGLMNSSQLTKWTENIEPHP